MDAPNALPPGPRGLPLLGVLPPLIRDPLATCMDNQRRYGGVVRLPVLRGSVYLVTDPELVEEVLVRSNANHWKGRLFRRADFLFGNGLVLNDGPSWQHQRRIMQPGFHASRLMQAVPAMATGAISEKIAGSATQSRGRFDALDGRFDAIEQTIDARLRSIEDGQVEVKELILQASGGKQKKAKADSKS